MNWTQEQFEEICAAYCLGSLSAVERLEFEEVLSQATPEQKAAFDQMMFAAQHMPLNAPLSTPPSELKQKLLSALTAGVAQTVTAPVKSKSNWADALRGFRFKSTRLTEVKLFEDIYRRLHFDRPTVAVSVPAALLLICVYFFLEQAELHGSLSESNQRLNSQITTVAAQTQELTDVRQKLAELEQKLTQQNQKVAELEGKSTEAQNKLTEKEKEISEIKLAAEQSREFLELMKSNDLRVTEIKGLKPYPQGRGKIFYSPKTKVAYIHISNLPPAPANKDYELWMMEGKKPVAAGVFVVEPDKTALAKVSTGMVVESHRLSAFSVTMEAKGGSPTPKGPTYLTGNVRL